MYYIRNALILAGTEKKDVALGVSLLNMSDPGPMALASPNLDERKAFLVCFKTLLDFPKHCLYIVHSQPSVLLGSQLSSSYSSSFLVLPLPL
jgi:hypothetical protein